MDILLELSFFKSIVLQALNIGLINCQYLIDRELIISGRWCKTGEMYLLPSGFYTYGYNKQLIYVEDGNNHTYYLKNEHINIAHNGDEAIYSVCYSQIIQDWPDIKFDKKVNITIVKYGNIFPITIWAKYFIYNDKKYTIPQFVFNGHGVATTAFGDMMTDIPEENAVWLIKDICYKAGALIPYQNKRKNIQYTTVERDFMRKTLTNIPYVPTHISLADVLFRPGRITELYKDIFTDTAIPV